jgi:toxin HigB-1
VLAPFPVTVGLTSDNCHYKGCAVIRRFRHRGLRRLYEDDDRRELNPQHADKIARMLARLDVATRPEQLDLPGFRLHPLKGELAGYWSITVRANWRIIFRFEEGDATDVDLVDYH